LYKKQADALFYPKDRDARDARYALIEASTKTGKTVGSMAWLFEQAYLGKRRQNYWWIAPIRPQARIAFERTKAGLPAFMYVSNESDLTITLPNGAIIWYKGSDNPDSLYGEDVYAAVVDEASRCKEAAWHAIRSTLTATRGPVRIIGNVKGRRNWFFALSRRAEQGEPGMSYTKLVAYDAVAAGVLVDEEVEDARRVLPDAVFRELYLAEPSDDQGNPFGLKAIAAAVRPLSGLPSVAWGWDLGKKQDWTVGIGLDQNGHVAEWHRWQKPWQSTIPEIRRITGMTPAKVDSTGLGDPVLEALQDGGPNSFEGYLFTMPSKQKLMEGLALDINNQTIGYPESEITMELEIFEYEYSRLGVRYTAPEGFHDDCVCALALANLCRSQNRGAGLWAMLGKR